MLPRAPIAAIANITGSAMLPGIDAETVVLGHDRAVTINWEPWK